MLLFFMLQVAEDIDLKKKDNDDIMREFRVSEAHEFPPTGSKQYLMQGSGCSSVEREVASNNRGPWFEFSHWPKFLMNVITVNCYKD